MVSSEQQRHPFSLANYVAEYEKPVEGIEGARTSLAFVQLEKHNERLKEALIRSVGFHGRLRCDS